MRTTTFSPARFVCVAVLYFKNGRGVLRRLKYNRLLTVSRFSSFNGVLRRISSLRLLIGLRTILEVMSRASYLASVRYSAIQLLFTRRCFGRHKLSHAVISRSTRLLVANGSVQRVFRGLRVARALMRVVHLGGLKTSMENFRVRFRVTIIRALLHRFLRFMRDFFPVAHFVSTYLKRATRPLRLYTMRIVNANCFNVNHLSALLPLFRMVTMVSFV